MVEIKKVKKNDKILQNYLDFKIESNNSEKFIKNNNILFFCECGSAKSRNASQCRECEKITRKTSRPNVFQLIEDFKELKNFVQVGKKYNVSDNAVRKWVAFYDISDKI